MIVKELDPPASADAFVKAGLQAEAQMAFYLRRAFSNDPSVLILNGLRLEHAGDVAQIDHLVLHPYGAIIVESKSVTSRLKVNERGEWTRWFGGAAKGMPSPLLQAERQADFLESYLSRYPLVAPDTRSATDRSQHPTVAQTPT